MDIQPIDAVYLISNDTGRKCGACGEVHAFLSVKAEGVACDTPALFPKGCGLGGDKKGSWGKRVPLVPASG